MHGRSPWSSGLTLTATSRFGGEAAFTCQKANSASSFTVHFGGCCMDLHANSLRRAIVIACAVVLTAGSYFLSSGLQRLWWAVWLAPLPILLLASRLRASQAFAVALVARSLAAALNFWDYLRHTVQFPLWLALITILVPAASFALAVVFYRGLLRKGNPWLAMLAFPLTVVAAEYLFSLSQGTFLNTGYTQ